MKKKLKHIIFIIIILIPFFANAQYKTIEKQKAELIIEIYKQLIWRNDQNIDYIIIGVLNGSEVLKNELNKAKPKRIKTGAKIDIKMFSSVSEMSGRYHIIFYDGKNEQIINKIREKTNNVATLLITNGWDNNKDIQVNFVIKESGFLSFQYNPKNIANQEISVPDKFIGMGGVNVYAQEILDETEKKLKNKESELKNKENELKQKEKKLEEKDVEIEEKEKEILEKDIEIGKKENEIEKKIQKIKEKDNQIIQKENQIKQKEKKLANLDEIHQQALNEKMAIINNKEKEINQQQKKVKLYEERLVKQEDELNEQKEFLKKQKLIAADYTTDIKNKKAQLKKLNFTIQKQRWAIIIFIFLLFIIIILLFFIFRNLKEKKKQNALLEEKNSEIKAQSEEMEDINVELEKLSIVASETSNAVAILDAKGNFEWLNSGYTKLYGYTLQLLRNELGKNIKNVSSNQKIDEILKKCINDKQSVLYETYITSRKGKKRWAQTSLSPILNNKNEVTKLVIIDSDITEIKEAEQQIKDQNKKIIAQAQELEKLSIVAEKTDNAVIIADAGGEIEWVNAAFERLHGISFEGFKEKFGSNLIQSNLKPEVLDKIAGGLKNKKSITYSSKTKTVSGKELWLQTTLTPMFEDDGKLSKLFAIDANITQIKIAEQKIAKQNKSITQSIKYASRIQAAVLPPENYINNFFENHFVFFRPRDIVSGDFYWLTETNNKIVFTAADCTGHGVPGAFMSMLGIAFLNEIIGKSPIEEIRPDIILNKLREKVKIYLHQTGKEGEAKDGMDMAFCIFEKDTNTLHYAGAHFII